MKVVITGGTGFVGRTLAGRLLERGSLRAPSGSAEPIDSLVLLDAAVPSSPLPGLDGRAEIVAGDVGDPAVLAAVIDQDDVSVFHLASMVSAECERDFDRALAVNLDGGRAVLEACRARGSRLRLVFASSLAAFGGVAASGVVSDDTKLTPETTYGMTKVICELLVNDYTRKGYLDGRSARLPTVVVRPGRPNAAASSWVSGVFREPLNGEECVVPVEPTTTVPLTGYRTVVDNLIRLHDLDGTALGADRAVSLPSLDVSAQEMIDTLRRVTDRPLGPISLRPDPDVVEIYRGWAQHSSFRRATDLGLIRDESLDAVIAAYIEDFAPPAS